MISITKRRSHAMGGSYRELWIRLAQIAVFCAGKNQQGWFGVLYVCGRRLWLLPIIYKTEAK